MDVPLLATPIRPPTRLARAIELIEAQSAYSQHQCAPPAESRRLGLRAERIGSMSLILTRKSTNLLYNKLSGLGQAAPATQRQLDRAIELARAERVAALGVPMGSAARPTRVRNWLAKRGFELGRPGGKLWRDGSPLLRDAGSPGVSVRRVEASEASVWVDVIAQVWRTFGFRRPWFEARVVEPGWRHYLAWIDDQPVGAGAMFVGRVGATPVGHLTDGATLRVWRRKGVQSAIIRKRVADGLALGCAAFTAETAPPLPRAPLVSFRNLCRQGFALAYLRESWRLALD